MVLVVARLGARSVMIRTSGLLRADQIGFDGCRHADPLRVDGVGLGSGGLVIG
jgi:hypothetical protein